MQRVLQTIKPRENARSKYRTSEVPGNSKCCWGV